MEGHTNHHTIDKTGTLGATIQITGTTPMKPVMAADYLCEGLISLTAMIINMETWLSKEAPPVSWVSTHRTLTWPLRGVVLRLYLPTIYSNKRKPHVMKHPTMGQSYLS